MQYVKEQVLVFDSGHVKFDTLHTFTNCHKLRLFFSPFEAGSYYVAQADPKLAILLLQSLRVRLQLWAITHSCKFSLVLNT